METAQNGIPVVGNGLQNNATNGTTNQQTGKANWLDRLYKLKKRSVAGDDTTEMTDAEKSDKSPEPNPELNAHKNAVTRQNNNNLRAGSDHSVENMKTTRKRKNSTPVCRRNFSPDLEDELDRISSPAMPHKKDNDLNEKEIEEEEDAELSERKKKPSALEYNIKQFVSSNEDTSECFEQPYEVESPPPKKNAGTKNKRQDATMKSNNHKIMEQHTPAQPRYATRSRTVDEHKMASSEQKDLSDLTQEGLRWIENGIISGLLANAQRVVEQGSQDFQLPRYILEGREPEPEPQPTVWRSKRLANGKK